ncbi:SNF2 domain protein [Wolffia australiana]
MESLICASPYESLMKDSIDRFIGEIRRGNCDVSGLQSVFFRILQSQSDPPLEVMWFYSAVCYYQKFSSTEGLLGRIFAVRDLLQLVSACAASCNGDKSIALLAPVVYELQRITLEVEKSQEHVSTKELKKLRKEIYLLAEGVSSYVSICCSKNYEGRDSSGCLAPYFVDLVGVWTSRWADSGDGLLDFFPFVNDEIREGFRRAECPISYLSGAVIAEVFFVMLRVKLQKGGASSPELRSDLKVWIVGSVTGFRSAEFFGILLMLLLDGALPSSLLLKPSEESFLRDVLYDSVILVDYPFLYSDESEEDDSSTKNLCLALLVVTHRAIQAARARGDQTKVTAYLTAFSRSALPSTLTRMISYQVGPNKPTSPEALFKSLLNCKDVSLLRHNLLFGEKTRKTSEDDVFVFNTEGNPLPEEEEEEDDDDVMFLSAACGMKRKGSEDSREMEARTVKHKLEETSGESDVENPTSDEEMEDND